MLPLPSVNPARRVLHPSRTLGAAVPDLHALRLALIRLAKGVDDLGHGRSAAPGGIARSNRGCMSWSTRRPEGSPSRPPGRGSLVAALWR
jgi:hypothetical protein